LWHEPPSTRVLAFTGCGGPAVAGECGRAEVAPPGRAHRHAQRNEEEFRLRPLI